MSGTKSGGKIAAETNKRLYGPTFYKRIGALGGSKGTGHTFGHGKVDPSVIGALGGSISRRGRKLTSTERLTIKQQFYDK